MNTYRFLIITLGGLFSLIMIASLLLVTDVYWLRPVTHFVWRDAGTGETCNGTVLASPDISQARIVDFAADAAVSLNSFDYYNQEVVIGSALRQYFTASGMRNYAQALESLPTPGAIRANYVVQTAYKSGLPNIREEGFLNGRRFWQVEVPVAIYRQSNVSTVDRRLILTMLIVTLRPSELNPNGIGIDSISVVPQSANSI